MSGPLRMNWIFIHGLALALSVAMGYYYDFDGWLKWGGTLIGFQVAASVVMSITKY